MISRLTKNKSLILLFSLLIIVFCLFCVVKIYSNDNKIIDSDLPEIIKPGDEEAFESSNLIINKIDINVPIMLDVDSSNKQTYNQMLENGVAHMLGTSKPGQKGNIVIFGHSSASREYEGEYDKVFSKLNDLEIGDQVHLESNEGEKIEYILEKKDIVLPDDASCLDQNINNRLTLITCWPIGSDKKRLVLYFNQQ